MSTSKRRSYDVMCLQRMYTALGKDSLSFVCDPSIVFFPANTDELYNVPTSLTIYIYIYIYIYMYIIRPHQAKKCLQAYAKYSDLDHPAHMQSIFRAFILHHTCCTIK